MKIILIGFIFLILPVFVFADEFGQKTTFFVDSDFDALTREQVFSTLRAMSSSAYFYIDNNYWSELTEPEREVMSYALQNLGAEFDTVIYPTLTRTFGFEYKPGIDKDTRVTVLIHPMLKSVGGYFTTSDEYPLLQVPNSNEREMVYLNSHYLNTFLIKSFLAHELVHLITFNQKDRKFGLSEEIWLNEARAEYAPFLCGYDEDYENSNLRLRVRDFREEPNDSLVEWKNQKADYGVINLFIRYLAEHYGTEILIDSLHSAKTGLDSLNFALTKNGFEQDFSQIFTDWTIAVYLNDCSLSEKYCYLHPDLSAFHITPQINFLPIIGESSLAVSQTVKNWSGNWYKFIGGNKALKVEFIGISETEFKIPYIIQDTAQDVALNFLELDVDGKGVIYVPDFNKKNISLTIIPSIQREISIEDDMSYSFSWFASTVERTPGQEQELIQEFLVQIENLKLQIANIQAKINILLAQKQTKKIDACAFLPTKIENNLYYGMGNNPEVCLLQQLLKEQGKDIYPEALVTGYFGPLTRAAVIRFQERYSAEILEPLGLKKPTGYVGPSTRAKLNQL